MAVKFVLFSFFPNASNSVIGVANIVTYLNHMGGLGSEALNAITKQIWHWRIDRGNWLLCEHVPGIENCHADHLSRFFNDNIKWSLVSTKHFRSVMCRIFHSRNKSFLIPAKRPSRQLLLMVS